MNEVLMGMAIQAFVTAMLWQCNIIIPSPGQLVFTGVFFLIGRWMYLKSEERKTRQTIATLLITTALISTTTPASSYVLPVIDVANLAPNTTTSIATTYTAEQSYWMRIALQDIAEMERINLARGNGPRDDILRLLSQLDGTVKEGVSINYLIENLKRVMGQRYPGYQNPGKWIPQYELWTRTMLDTARGLLGTVHDQFTLPERIREVALTAKMHEGVESAIGNLDIQQQNGRIMLQLIEEGRKNRQLTGAALNVQAVALSNDTNREAAGTKVFNDWIERSQRPTNAYSGAGGFGVESIGWGH